MEEIIDTELLICDPHHHLWEHHSHFGGRYLTEELMADIGSGHRVVRTVCVECDSGYRTSGPEMFRPVGETEFVVAANPDGPIAGIVGFADLRAPQIGDVLAAHIEAGKARFRGIRQSSSWDPSPEMPPGRSNPSWLLPDPAFRSGIEVLVRAGLSFDALMYHTQLHELVDLARAQPEVQIVLNHLGDPIGIGPYAGRREEVLTSWRSAMSEVAGCSNVTVKLGGIGMASLGINWLDYPGGASSEEIAAVWGPEIRWCIEQFGVDRCMFESNFPVDGASFGYTVVWNAFKRMVADASPAEKSALFHDTATAVYRL